MSVRQFCQRLCGAQILRLDRRGKHLVFGLMGSPRLGEYRVLLAHLRMTGNLYLDSIRQEIPWDTSLVFHLVGRGRVIFQDRRGLGVCQLLTESETAARFSHLGLEPLSPQFTPAKLFEMTRHSRLPIKTFLMEQRHLAGLGNIYAVEALFRAGIHPQFPAASLSPRRAHQLHRAIVVVLKDAVKSAVGGYRRPTGFRPQETFGPQVYGREGLACWNCGEVIRRCVIRSRSTFYCPHCQRM